MDMIRKVINIRGKRFLSKPMKCLAATNLNPFTSSWNKSLYSIQWNNSFNKLAIAKHFKRQKIFTLYCTGTGNVSVINITWYHNIPLKCHTMYPLKFNYHQVHKMLLNPFLCQMILNISSFQRYVQLFIPIAMVKIDILAIFWEQHKLF